MTFRLAFLFLSLGLFFAFSEAAPKGGCSCSGSDDTVTCTRYFSWDFLEGCKKAHILILVRVGASLCDRWNNTLSNKFSTISIENSTPLCNCFDHCMHGPVKTKFSLCIPPSCTSEVSVFVVSTQLFARGNQKQFSPKVGRQSTLEAKNPLPRFRVSRRPKTKNRQKFLPLRQLSRKFRATGIRRQFRQRAVVRSVPF